MHKSEMKLFFLLQRLMFLIMGPIIIEIIQMRYLVSLLVVFFVSLSGFSDGGHSHHVLVRPDGSMWSWGANDFGQLGVGNNTPSLVPIEIGSGNTWIEVVRGQFHNLALDEFGRVWSWGANSDGQLGLGHTFDSESPTLVSGLNGIDSIGSGAYHSFAVSVSGNVYAWGRNKSGQLGDGTNTNSSTPILLSVANIDMVRGGADHTLALSHSGNLHAWGSNGYGQLGDGTQFGTNVPVQIGMNSDWEEISAGHHNSMGLRIGDNVFVWGKNTNGQLGTGSTMSLLVPTSAGPDVNQISSGAKHTLLNSFMYGVHTSGSNNFNQLGNGPEKSNALNAVPLTPGTNWSIIDAGEYHNILESGNGEVYSFGRNNRGQGGVGYKSETNPITNIFGPMSRFKNEYSMQFDGVDDKIYTGKVFNELDSNNSFSISVWFKTNVQTNKYLLTHFDPAPSHRGTSLGIESTGNISTVIRNDNSTLNYIHVISNISGLNNNKWHNATITYDGTSTALGTKIYINGLMVSTTIAKDNLSGSIIPSSNSFYISGSQSHISGYLDNVALWNKELTSSEIAEFFNLATDLSEHSTSANLIGWWRMGDGDEFPIVKDHSGQGNDGVMINMAGNAIVPNYPGFNKNAISFDGVDDYVNLNDIHNLDNDKPFSFSVWFKTESTTNGVLFSNWDTTSGYYFYVGSVGEFGLLGKDGTGTLEVSTPSDPMNDNKWHHALFTYSGNAKYAGTKLYIDGVMRSTQSAFDSLTLSGSMTSPSNLIIGADNNGTSGYFDGKTDEISLWNKELTPTEVTEIYAGNTHINLKQSSMSSNLVGWWRMGDGDSYPMIKDHSVNANHGTMVNMNMTSIHEIGKPDITDGLVAWWDFEETSGTSSTDLISSITGTLNGGMSFGTNSGNGVYGNALVFDGSDDNINFGLPTELQFTASDNFSISLWFKTSSNNTTFLYANGKSGLIRETDLVLKPTGNLNFSIRTGASVKHYCEAVPPTNYDDNQWHNIVAVRDMSLNGSSGASKIYFDGTALTVTDTQLTSLSGTLYETTGAVYLGSSFMPADFFNGSIDDLRVYNKVLAPDVILEIFKSGNAQLP